MFNKLIILISCVNFIFGIGLKALVIPQNALSLASSSTGLANYSNIDLNPAAISNHEPYVSFSNNKWFADMSGQKISVVWNENNRSYFSFESLNVTDIELRNEIASEEPVGFFGAYWYAFNYSKGLNFSYLKKNNIKAGYSFTYSLSKLHTESMRGITFNFGLVKNISDNFSLGFVVNDIGKQQYNGLKENVDMEAGMGIAYNLKKMPFKVSSDIIYRNSDILSKLSLNTNFSYVNFICGFTKGESYNDYSFGLSMDFSDWSFVFGSLVHDNSSLGNPSSIEIIKTF